MFSDEHSSILDQVIYGDFLNPNPNPNPNSTSGNSPITSEMVTCMGLRFMGGDRPFNITRIIYRFRNNNFRCYVSINHRAIFRRDPHYIVTHEIDNCYEIRASIY